MDLFCPHCTHRVSVPDDKAGLVMSCPLCAKQFMAPSLAPQPAPPPAPKPPAPPPTQPPVLSTPAPSAPTPVDSYGVGPVAAPPMPSPVSVPIPAPPAPVPPPPPPPPGDYKRSFTLHLRANWLAFVPPACLLLILVLSFFSWHYTGPTRAYSLWNLSFSSDNGQGQFLAYTLFFLPTLVLAIVALLFDKNLVPTPPQLAPLMMWKNLLVALLLTLTFLMLCFDLVSGYLSDRGNPATLVMELAFRVHLVAMVASFAMFWLHWRKMSNAPPPKCEFRW